MELMRKIDNNEAETTPTVRVEITTGGKSVVLEKNLNNVLINLSERYSDLEIANIMLSDKWYLVNKLLKRKIGGSHNG